MRSEYAPYNGSNTSFQNISEDIRFCPVCGGEVKEPIAKYCYHCGNKLKDIR